MSVMPTYIAFSLGAVLLLLLFVVGVGVALMVAGARHDQPEP